MNEHLRAQVEALLQRHDRATLATCGAAGPQISVVTYRVENLQLELSLGHGSDHLFNLETQPQLVLLTNDWRLQGQGKITGETQGTTASVTMTRLHILNGQHTVETIDF